MRAAVDDIVVCSSRLEYLSKDFFLAPFLKETFFEISDRGEAHEKTKFEEFRGGKINQLKFAARL